MPQSIVHHSQTRQKQYRFCPGRDAPPESLGTWVLGGGASKASVVMQRQEALLLEEHDKHLVVGLFWKVGQEEDLVGGLPSSRSTCGGGEGTREL